ncbi:MAG: hypothetical protein AAFN78_12650 [Pseudomonadota bacterium]
MSVDYPEIASANVLSSRQQVFIRYFTAVLIDLVVLGLFGEYWDKVIVSSFTFALLAAVLLQLLLKLTLAIEHRVAAVFKGRSGAAPKVLRVLSAWAILFGSKFVMLWAIQFAFGHRVAFEGAYHGVVAFIVVVLTMVAAEEAIARLVRRLG